MRLLRRRAGGSTPRDLSDESRQEPVAVEPILDPADLVGDEEWFHDHLVNGAIESRSGESESPVQRHSLRRNAAALMGSQVITWVLALVLTTFQTRILGPEGLGQLRIANALWGIAAVFVGAGATNMIIVELARDGTRTALVNRVVALQSCIYFISWPLVIGFSLLAGYSSSILLTVTLIGLSVLPAAISSDARAAFYGFERMTQPSVIDVANRVLATVLIVGVLSAGGRVQASAVVLLINALFHAVLIRRLLRRTTGYAMRPSFSGLGAVARAGMPFLLIEGTLIIYQQVDTVIMSLIVNSDEIGYYGAASQLYGTLLFIPTVLMTTVFPVFARLDESDPGGLVRLTRRGLRFLILAGVPIGLGTVSLAHPICTLLFGQDFKAAGDVLAVYGVVIIIMFPIILLAQYSIATGRQVKWAVMLLGAIVCTVPLDLVLVPFARHAFGNGAAGGALSYIVTESVMLVVACSTFARHLIDRSVLRRAAVCLPIGGAMLASVWLLRDQFILLPAAVGALVYAGLIAVFRVLDDDEMNLVRGLTQRLTGVLPGRGRSAG
jgi:O-antigen/teichoic acid export membrane protein